MRVLQSKYIEQDKYTAVTLGNFDGIHLGHQKLISTVKEYAEKYGLKTIVFSFYPHPKSFFFGEDFYTIFTRYEKERLVEKMGVDELILYPFTAEFANMEPEDFAEYFFDRMKCKVLVVGDDYCFGKDRRGDYNLLKSIGDKKGVDVIKISSINDNDIRISSTRIRECIKQRDFKEAYKLLGKSYFVSGNVVGGKRIGRKINFPTANIVTPNNKLLPPDGVYLTKTEHKGKIYNSITNVGKNPTVGGKHKTVETYIFDFEQDIYGDEIIVRFYDFIRDECKFNSIDELKEQITKDKAKAVELFRQEI